MLFYQASAPAGWTKLTADNNKTLRVVSGSGGGSGGTNSFTSAFAVRGVPLTAHNHNGSVSDQSNNHTHSGTTGNQSANHTHGGNTGNASANHNHPMNYGGASGTFVDYVGKQRDGYKSGNRNAVDDIGVGRASVSYSPQNTNASGAAHTHSLTTGNNSSSHTHSFNTGGISANHRHNLSISNEGSSSANMDFRVQYIDVIVCKKD